MQPIVFDKITLEGFRTNKVESIAVSNGGHRLFVGTSDGSLVAYDCQTNLTSASKINCNVFSTVRNQQTREKKPVSNLVVVENWGILIGIVDSIITAFDLYSFQTKSSLPDTKGCHVFSLNQNNNVIVVANKRKISLYTWIQGSSSNTANFSSASSIQTGFYLRKEISSLPELPKNITCISNAIVVGLKRSYEVFDINTLVSNKILDVDKDQRMLCLELPASELRPSSILLSQNIQGLMVDTHKIMTASSTAEAAAAISNIRLEWASAPMAIYYLNPFIVSLLQDSVEIHDVMSLASLQRISMPSMGSTSAFTSNASVLSFTSCEVDDFNGLEYGYVCTGDAMVVLRMTPLASQVMALVEASRFEDAINLCMLCQHNLQLKEIDIPGVHERYALSLFQRGDFDNAMKHYIKANTSPKKVLALLPDLIPSVFHAYLGISSPVGSNSTASNRVSVAKPAMAANSYRLTGVPLQKAASAVVGFCEHHRMQNKSLVEISDRLKAASSGNNIAAAIDVLEIANMNIDFEEVLRLAELIDTILLSALLHCYPSRRNSVVDFLSSIDPINRCHMEASSNLLASQGNSFTEALLWLYRSHGEHKRVLVALTEDRCVGVGAGTWTREQFYHWMSDYLRWLWFNDDVNLPILALNALRPVLEYDAQLGLSVLIGIGKSPLFPVDRTVTPLSSTSGGKGLEIHDILTFLNTVRPKPLSVLIGNNLPSKAPSKGQSQFAAMAQYVLNQLTAVKRTLSEEDETNAKRKVGQLLSAMKTDLYDAPYVRPPLVTGKALGISYLEWRVLNNSAPPSIYDEYAELLIEGINALLSPNASLVNPNSPKVIATSNSKEESSSVDLSTDLTIYPYDADATVMLKIFRMKLQYFLQISVDYLPERILNLLPSGGEYELTLHEYALVLSRLGKHDEVLKIYLSRLFDLQLAENYCDRMYSRLLNKLKNATNKKQIQSNTDVVDEGIYLILIRVLLGSRLLLPLTSPDIQEIVSFEPIPNLNVIISLAEKYHERLNPLSFIALLPKKIPLAALSRYLSIVLEYAGSRKRNLQIIHQLLRVQEVNIRTTQST